MKELSDQIFERIKIVSGHMSDVQFNHCAFMHCRLISEEDPAKRVVIQRLHLCDCRTRGCIFQRAIIEDTIVDNLQMPDHELLTIWGSVFKHVVLRGRFGSININKPYTSRIGRQEQHIKRQFEEAAEEYYHNLDWAIDIREAQAMGLRIRGIPAHLIRRDPLTQVVIKRDEIAHRKWDSIDLGGAWWTAILKSEARKPECEDDIVLVAPKLDRTFEVQLEGLRRLRAAGIAAPD